MASASWSNTSATTPGTRSCHGVEASRAWKNTSGFWAVPRITGAVGRRRRSRCSSIASFDTSERTVSSSSSSTRLISCEVRNPSKKCRNGTRVRRVAACDTAAKSWASWTELAHNIANPVERAAMTSL